MGNAISIIDMKIETYSKKKKKTNVNRYTNKNKKNLFNYALKYLEKTTDFTRFAIFAGFTFRFTTSSCSSSLFMFF